MQDNVNAEMLILARELRDMTQTELAESSQIAQGRISKYEHALADITQEELVTLGHVLGFPVEFFYQEGHRYNDEGNELFHRRRRSLPKTLLKRIHARMNKFRLDVGKLLDGVDIESPYDIPIYRLEDNGGDIEAIAAKVRGDWGLDKGPIDNVTRTIEDASCIIISSDFRTNKFDEVVVWGEPIPPVMLLNSRAPGDRLRFSLAHALGHMVMHHGLPFYPGMEDEANQFASAFLMPKADIEKYFNNVTIEKLADLKLEWKVSIQSLIFRARDLGKISEEQYTSLYKVLSRRGYRKKEPHRLSRERPLFFEQLLSFYLDDSDYTINDLSRLFTISEQDFMDWYQPNRPRIELVPKDTSYPSDDHLPNG